jgi:hypothetical protein
MTRPLRLLAGIVILVMTGSMYGCDSGGGIGVGSSIGGARWGGGSNPGVMVMGGPVYR